MALLQRELFLKFFDSERVVDKEATMFDYEVRVNEELTLVFSVWPYDKHAYLTLQHEKFKVPIFDISMHHLKEIIYQENALFFYKENITEPILNLQVRPSFKLRFCA